MVSSVSTIRPGGPARARLLLRRCTMLRERYEPINVLALVSAPGMELDPMLTELDRLLDDDALFQAVKADLARRHPRTLTDGRPSTPVEVILRMLVIKHLYGWSYEQICQLVSGSLVLRQFCRVYVEAVPRDTTLLRWANLIRPTTLHQLHDHVVGRWRAGADEDHPAGQSCAARSGAAQPYGLSQPHPQCASGDERAD